MILEILREKGFRITKARAALARVLDVSTGPKTVIELIDEISLQNVFPDRTTIYRELEQLEQLALVEQVVFDDGVARFQKVMDHHAHHVICTNCKMVEKIAFDESSLEKAEAILSSEKGFSSIRHSLSFYGVCKRCR